ncbi:hypothetical protein SAMN04488692_1362 [Halarsenatibacter silvermanii]|uniref:Uncharacterized protein n=1 Tax=Halarsenatibacter silvermanii TaxID=321763 RepID=A0A1G9T9C7_9FIRM|nr:hypothetical protein SAMN04488692_1362 [Halarsenatibacter silvermanii]
MIIITIIQDLAYNMYRGLPLAGWLGIITYISLIATASVMVLTRKGIYRFSFKTHKNLARLTIVLATIHFIFAISVYI